MVRHQNEAKLRNPLFVKHECRVETLWMCRDKGLSEIQADKDMVNFCLRSTSLPLLSPETAVLASLPEIPSVRLKLLFPACQIKSIGRYWDLFVEFSSAGETRLCRSLLSHFKSASYRLKSIITHCLSIHCHSRSLWFCRCRAPIARH